MKNLSDSQISVSQVGTEYSPKEDIICLHDANLTVPEGSNPKYIKSLKSHWNPLMHKLGCYNIANLKDVKAQINKKISIMDSGLSVFQTNLFVNNFKFTLGDEYEAKCTTIMVEPD